MSNEIIVKQKQAYDTEQNWSKNNPVLLEGQLAYSSDNYGKYKIGDGKSYWNELEYADKDGDNDKLDGYHATELPVSTPQQKAIDKKVSKNGDTMTGTLNSSIRTDTFINGNKGKAIINSTITDARFIMLDRLNTVNGAFIDGIYDDERVFFYTPKSTIDTGSNSILHKATILTESGKSYFRNLGIRWSNAWHFTGDTYTNDAYLTNEYYNDVGFHFYAINNESQFLPSADNIGLLGQSHLRWKQIYGVNAYISTSDRREKKEISYIGEDNSYDTAMPDKQLEQLIMGIKPVIFKRINGESGRPHHGLIAQDFEKLLKEIGLSDHAAFIKSPKTKNIEKEIKAEKEVINDDIGNDIGNKNANEAQKELKQEVIEGEYTYGFRYEELITDVIRFAQIQKKRADNLEERLEQLEKTLLSTVDKQSI